MGLKDAVTATYMRQNAVFADAFNYFVYDGKQVIDPNNLEELDTREIAVPYGNDDAGQPVQRTRDVIKSLTAMTDRKRAYCVLAIENQSNVHYAMPVKNMIYDALQYTKQVELAIASHKKANDYRSGDSDEFLSGFMKQDRLLPVATLVIYFGQKAWDGPLSLHDMFEEQDAQFLSIVPDYRINLIAPAAIEDSEFDKFSSTLKEVLQFIKYANDKEQLLSVMQNDEGFQHLGREEINVLNACAGANLNINAEKEEYNVCLAMQMLQQEAEEKGRQSGREEGRRDLISSILRVGAVNMEKLAEATGMSVDELKEFVNC